MEKEPLLSLCMIVKNEAADIRRCLDSVKGVVDEIIIVDTGSDDDTADICRSYGARVLELPWKGSFAEARNAGLQEASGDWILWLDADEEVDVKDAGKLRDVLAQDRYHIATVRLINYIGDEPPNLDRAYYIAHHRLFRNFFGFRFAGSIHEQLNAREVLGDHLELLNLPVQVFHYGYMEAYVHNKNKSERNLSMLLEQKQNHPEPWTDYHIASEYYRTRDYRKAFDAVNESILAFLQAGLAPPSLLYKLKYESLIHMGSFEGAYPGIDKAIEMYPDYVDLHYYKGMILLHLDRLEEALKEFLFCIQLGESNISHLTLAGVGSFHAWYWVGRSCERLMRYEDAMDAYQLCLALSPEHTEAEAELKRLTEAFPDLGQQQRMPRLSVSLCMIVKNEEASIERVLCSVKGLVDEIIIIDTGSADRTKELAQKHGATVHDFEWVNHFAKARNYSFSKATKDYILWLDADDEILPKDRLALARLRRTLPPHIDTVTMPYHLAFDSSGIVTSSLRRNRLVRRSCHFEWHGAVHEFLAVAGNSYSSDVAITHRKNKAYTDRNLRIYRQMQVDDIPFSPRERYYFANELRDNALYEEAIANYELFLNTNQGWVEDHIQACIKMGDCHGKLGRETDQLHALYRSFDYDKPRAEACCAIGGILVNGNKYRMATYWYEQAIQLPNPPEMLSMSDKSTWTWLPHLQLCLCFDRLGEYDRSFEHNEKARAYHATHAGILYNRKYFKDRFGDRYVKDDESIE